VIKKRYLFMAGTAVAAALWCRLRDEKYPLAEGYLLINIFVVPESFLSSCILRIANSRLASMKLLPSPRGIKGETNRKIYVLTGNGLQ
jgi:acetyl esterase